MISQCAAERDAWREVKNGWRPLYGDVDQFGVAVEWHDFRTACSFDWGKSFHPRSLEFCLNLEGHGQVGATGKMRSDYAPGNCGYYAIGDELLPASRRANDHHQFVTLEFSRNHLQKQFVQNESDLEPEIRRVIFGDEDESVVARRWVIRPWRKQRRSFGTKARRSSSWHIFFSRQRTRNFSACGKNASRANVCSARKNC